MSTVYPTINMISTPLSWFSVLVQDSLDAQGMHRHNSCRSNISYYNCTMYIPRHLTGAITRAMTSFPVVLVTGARQTGKTTLLRTEFGVSHEYISLERPDIRNRAQADPVGFFAQYTGPVILDEIQYAPELLHYIKELIEPERKPGWWLLTGSQNFSLMQGVSQTLAGRVAVLTLDPLSVRERLQQEQKTPDAMLERVFAPTARPAGSPLGQTVNLAEWLLHGGFPEPCLNKQVDRRLWFSGYVQTYLERDVRDVTQVSDLGAFSRFLMLVATRTGSLLNMADIADEISISAPTVKRWLSVLETSQLIYLLQPYYKNFGKRIRKSPKLYLLDPGLATFLLGLHSRDAVLQGPSLGPLVETAVVTEWLKFFRQQGEQPHVYYWQSGPGKEVDLIIERDGALYGMEVKATATPTARHGAGIKRWLELAGPNTRGALACNVDRPQALRPGIRAVPWHLGG